ncbi:hypothetical protein ACLFLC_19955 [Providencia rettgeri]
MVDAGAHRRMWRCELEVGVATAGDLVPSSAMAMLQLNVRGLVVSASSDAAMLERGEKKPPRGVQRQQVCMRFREEETAPAIGRKTARPDVQLGHFSRIFRLIRCERPAVGAARSAVAFSQRASAPGAAARRAALLQS